MKNNYLQQRARAFDHILDAVVVTGLDDSVGWIESIVAPLLDEDGSPSGALGINRDISQRVFDKEKLARLAMTDSLTGFRKKPLSSPRGRASHK